MRVGVRWSGLLILVAVLGAAALVWWLVVDWLVERAIEETGTEIVGARVDLDAADLGLWPAGLELTRLQVTNPSAPETNAVEVARIAGHFDLGRALLGQVVFDELAVEGMRFGTPRARSGAIGERRTTAAARRVGEEASRIAALVAGELPDPGAVADRLESKARAEMESAQAELDAVRTRWSQRLEELPSRDRLEAYRTQVANLETRLQEARGPAALTLAADVQKLADSVRSDLQALESATASWQEERTKLTTRVRELVDAKTSTLQRLRSEYGLSGAGLQNLSRLLLGPRAQGWVDQALRWHRRLSPLLEATRSSATNDSDVVVVERLRGRSVRVRFPEADPVPDRLVRRAALSVEVAGGTLEGELVDWTDEQPILGRPTRLHLAGERPDAWGPVRIDATIDRVTPGRTSDRLQARVEGWRLDGVSLSPIEDWPVRLDRARATLATDLTLATGSIDASLDADLREVAFAVGEADDPVRRALGQALAGVKSLTVSASAEGPTDDYALSLRSSLDTVLRDAVGKLVDEQVRALAARVDEKLSAALAGPREALREGLGDLGRIGDALGGRTDMAREVLSEATALGRPGARGLPGGLPLP